MGRAHHSKTVWFELRLQPARLSRVTCLVCLFKVLLRQDLNKIQVEPGFWMESWLLHLLGQLRSALTTFSSRRGPNSRRSVLLAQIRIFVSGRGEAIEVCKAAHKDWKRLQDQVQLDVYHSAMVNPEAKKVVQNRFPESHRLYVRALHAKTAKHLLARNNLAFVGLSAEHRFATPSVPQQINLQRLVSSGDGCFCPQAPLSGSWFPSLPLPKLFVQSMFDWARQSPMGLLSATCSRQRQFRGIISLLDVFLWFRHASKAGPCQSCDEGIIDQQG